MNSATETIDLTLVAQKVWKSYKTVTSHKSVSELS